MEEKIKNNDFMTIDEMADYLHIGRSLAYDLVHRPNFPVFKIGKRLIVNREKLISWLEAEYNEVE